MYIHVYDIFSGNPSNSCGDTSETNCQPPGGAKGKIGGSPKSVSFLLWKTAKSVQIADCFFKNENTELALHTVNIRRFICCRFIAVMLVKHFMVTFLRTGVNNQQSGVTECDVWHLKC